jgi:hypothetical protein
MRAPASLHQSSVLPEVAEPLRGQFSISYRVLMDAERHPGGLSQPGQHPAKGNGSPWGAALASEDAPRRYAIQTASATLAPPTRLPRVTATRFVAAALSVPAAPAKRPAGRRYRLAIESFYQGGSSMAAARLRVTQSRKPHFCDHHHS